MDNRQAGQDPNVEAARKRARRTAWVLGLAVVALYLWFYVQGGGVR